MHGTTRSDLEAAHARRADEPYVLRLYVAGGTPRSLRATQRLRALCDAHLPNRHDLHVIDVHRDPGRARDDDVLAVPTLVKASPAPLRKIVGDLSDQARVLALLGLAAAAER